MKRFESPFRLREGEEEARWGLGERESERQRGK